MDDVQKLQFENRLKRIAAGGVNTTAQIYIGPADDPDVVKRNKQMAQVPDLATNMLYPLSIIGAFLIGVLAVFISRYIRFHLLGGELTGEFADVWMIADGVVATAVVVALGSLFSFNGKIMKVAKTVGIVAMIGLMHNFVHVAPSTFGKVFSPEWVSEVVATTEPNSFLFRGVSLVSGKSQPAKPQLPTVMYLD